MLGYCAALEAHHMKVRPEYIVSRDSSDTRMAGSVGQRLLHNPVRGCLYLWGKSSIDVPMLEVYQNPGLGRVTLE